jgi:hypothetical protein
MQVIGVGRKERVFTRVVQKTLSGPTVPGVVNHSRMPPHAFPRLRWANDGEPSVPGEGYDSHATVHTC